MKIKYDNGIFEIDCDIYKDQTGMKIIKELMAFQILQDCDRKKGRHVNSFIPFSEQNFNFSGLTIESSEDKISIFGILRPKNKEGKEYLMLQYLTEVLHKICTVFDESYPLGLIPKKITIQQKTATNPFI